MTKKMTKKEVKDFLDDYNLPVLCPLPKRHWWVVTQNWSKYGHTIPAGFTTDLDSVPRIPALYTAIKGRSVWAALLHDYLYASQCVKRKEADQLFRKAMIEEGVPNWIAYSMYLSVRAFGGLYYKKIKTKASDGCNIETGVPGRLIKNHRTALDKK